MLAVESEPWAYAGGPLPYHDSFTLAVFARADLSERLLPAAAKIAHTLGATIRETVAAQHDPPTVGEHLHALVRRHLRRS